MAWDDWKKNSRILQDLEVKRENWKLKLYSEDEGCGDCLNKDCTRFWKVQYPGKESCKKKPRNARSLISGAQFRFICTEAQGCLQGWLSSSDCRQTGCLS